MSQQCLNGAPRLAVWLGQVVGPAEQHRAPGKEHIAIVPAVFADKGTGGQLAAQLLGQPGRKAQSVSWKRRNFLKQDGIPVGLDENPENPLRVPSAICTDAAADIVGNDSHTDLLLSSPCLTASVGRDDHRV